MRRLVSVLSVLTLLVSFVTLKAGAEAYLKGLTSNGLNWHYGSGYWIECDSETFQSMCVDEPTISSPGAYGFTPWIDFENGYYAVIAMEEKRVGKAPASGYSVKLEQKLQPLIEAALQ